MRQARSYSTLAGLVTLAALSGCSGGEGADGATPGIDVANQVVRVGILNDLSGPAATIGRPLQTGLEMLYRQINAGGSGLLPEGWTVEWTTRDHGYNPQQSVQMYNEISEDVFYLGLSMGSSMTLPLHPMLDRDDMLAIPASLSSRTAQNEHTPVVTPTYRTEGMRAVDWAISRAGPGVKLGIVYQQDDYGADALEGFELEAEYQHAEIVSAQPVTPAQGDYTAIVTALQSAGAEYVLLSVLPGGTGGVLGTAAQLGYDAVWIGNAPSWLDAFFDPDVIPPGVFADFHLITATRYWDEDIPGMAAFRKTFEAFSEGAQPDYYVIAGYLFGVVGIEAVRRAIEAGDPTRAGLIRAVHTIEGWDASGMFIPIDLSTVPYDAARITRVLKPIMERHTWEVVSDFASPASDAGSH